MQAKALHPRRPPRHTRLDPSYPRPLLVIPAPRRGYLAAYSTQAPSRHPSTHPRAKPPCHPHAPSRHSRAPSSSYPRPAAGISPRTAPKPLRATPPPTPAPPPVIPAQAGTHATSIAPTRPGSPTACPSVVRAPPGGGGGGMEHRRAVGACLRRNDGKEAGTGLGAERGEIPAASAGMTRRGAGMARRGAGMTRRGAGMTRRGAGTTEKGRGYDRKGAREHDKSPTQTQPISPLQRLPAIG